MSDADVGDEENGIPQGRVTVRRMVQTREIMASAESDTEARQAPIASLVIRVPLGELVRTHPMLVGRLVHGKTHPSAQTAPTLRVHNDPGVLMTMRRTCCLERRICGSR